MSRTDKTRPWWVRMADAPMVTCVPVHDHRFGPCTMPDRITPATADLDHRRAGCHWSGTASFNCYRYDNGGPEWAAMCREDRRRSRHQARRDLRAHLGALPRHEV